MIIAPTQSQSVFKRSPRLDAGYFCSPGIQAAMRLDRLQSLGVSMRQVAGNGGFGSVFHPPRFKRHLATSKEPALPYLRAFDVFEYLPQPADWISESRTIKIDELRVSPGEILLTRSGRNLGPSVMTDRFIEQFVLSDDLLRIRIGDGVMRNYVFAYLNTPTGQLLLRQDKTGSVIDHLSAGQVSIQLVPIFDDIVDSVSREIEESVVLREEARLLLADVSAATAQAQTPGNDVVLRNGWTVKSTDLRGRLDAAFHAVDVSRVRRNLQSTGGMRLGDVATVHKPVGRYKTYYVESAHGTPLLSGKNLLQSKLINPKYISGRSIGEDSRYSLKPGWICFQADGRAEERLGFPVVVTSDRTGWLASGHVARLIPNSGVDSGWLWAAMVSSDVQRQVASLACGSVVDALYEHDLRELILPAQAGFDSARVCEAWEALAAADAKERSAIAQVETAVLMNTDL